MSAKKSLNALRAEIDAIDEEIHDLLMRRTRVVEKVGASKGDTESAHRPEAQSSAASVGFMSRFELQ